MKAKSWRKLSFAVFFCVAMAVTSHAQTFTNLVNFNIANGDEPGYGSLVQGTDGNLYGVTVLGGVASNCTYTYGCGTVFKVTPDGVLTTLYSFCSLPNCADGFSPYAGLALAPNGNLYGATQEGGVGINCDLAGNPNCGTIFEITPQGKLTTIFTFSSGYNGVFPLGTLVLASNGDFYGTTNAGGNLAIGTAGTIFKITPSGTLTTLYTFCSTCGQAPYFPQWGLVQANNGNLYSVVGFDIVETTLSGNLTIAYNGYAHSPFVQPVGSLAQATDGNLYGTTSGTAFKMTLGGTMTTLYTFCSQPYCTDGSAPMSGVIQGTDGNFYGTTATGGASCTGYAHQGCGTVFELTPSGKLTTLHSFDGLDGDDPWAGLVQATNGDFYGTTSVYGTGSGVGTIFRLSMGLGPFVRALPSVGKVGSTVVILGTNLTGATSVRFNNATAKFQLVSATEIVATVPTGATTGKIKVTLPSGTLKSNVPFLVR